MTQTRALILFVAIILIWGINWTVTKLIVESIPPLWTTALRNAMAMGAILLAQVCTRQFLWPQKQDWPAILVVSVLHMSIYATLMAVGLQYISVGQSVILGYTTPLWVAPAAMIFLREPINKYKLLGLILGIGGVLILFDPFSGRQLSHQELLGNAILLIASLAWAINIIGIKLATWRVSPFQLLFWQFLVATVLTSLGALVLEGVPSVNVTSSVVWEMLYNGLIATALAFWIMNSITRHLPAIVTSLGLLATPIAGISFSHFFLGESLSTPLMVAGALIFMGIALSCVKPKPSKK